MAGRKPSFASMVGWGLLGALPWCLLIITLSRMDMQWAANLVAVALLLLWLLVFLLSD